jgi:uncharacterized protein YbbC (DUF1343 family)
MTKFGIDVLLTDQLDSLAGCRVGLITNDVATTAAIPQPLQFTRLALQQAGVQLVALFSPEHGLGAAAADGAEVGNEVDPLTGVTVYSLYGQTYQPTAEMLNGLDLLLFDIPDIGVRFYTYIWTLSHVLEACSEHQLPLWILDRPNPLGGNLADCEGPMLDTEISSFVGRWSIPIRHGLTVGELAQLWNAERGLGVDLKVIRAQGWTRAQRWSATGLPFIPTSPSLPSYETALIYPGTCLFEGTNVSEGRGTTAPFRQIGAPWLDAYTIANRFNELALPGLRARAVQFSPTASKYANELCQGIMLHVLDESTIRPVAAGLQLVRLISEQHPNTFEWLPYPTAAAGQGYGHFDRLVGNPAVRTALSQPATVTTAQIDEWTTVADWPARVQPYLLYD